MKLNYPSRISIIICTVFLLISYLTLYISNQIYVNFYVISLLALPIMLILTTTILNRFFYERIRVIYKKIYKFRGTSKFSDIDIDKVEKEAEEWAEAKEEELFQMKKDENYRREFIGNVSHELKTPIFNIQGYIQTLIDGGLEDHEINLKYLNRANKSVELKIEKFNIVDLVIEIFDLMEMKSKEMQVELKYNSKSKIQNVIADRDKIQQVLMNLVSNSIKYGKKGGYVLINFIDMESNILIEVSDNGIGIEEKSLNRLFERFYRVDKNRSREIGGTGLGLSIVKHILEGHGQSINVRSTKDIGSTFSFILPKA